MPLLSVFTPCGQLRLSSAKSYVQQWYEILPKFWGGGFDFSEVGTYNESKLYAVARLLALVTGTLERAGNQANPNKVVDLLPLLEIDFLLSPGAKATLLERQQALAAAMRLPLGAGASNVVAILRAIAGSAFLAYVPNPGGQGGQTIAPASPGLGPGHFTDVRQPAKLLQLVDVVAQVGVPIWCAYQALDTSAVPSATWEAGSSYATGQLVIPTLANSNGAYFVCQTAGTSGSTEPLWPGSPGGTVTDGSVVWLYGSTIAAALVPKDVVVVDAGKTSRMEKVTILSVATTPPPGSNTAPGYLYLEAVFTKAHDVGTAVTTGQVPYWWSTQRLNYAVLSAIGASDAATRAKVDAVFAKVLRAVDTWAIVSPTETGLGGGIVGPLSAGKGMGTSPIGVIQYVNSN